MIINNIEGRLVNTKANEAILKNLVHREFFDLSVYYVLVIEATEEYKKVSKITYDIADEYGLSEEDLYSSAVKNADEPVLVNMSSPFFQMIALANANMHNGSFYMLNTSLLDAAANAWDVIDILIIPSSIHETILVPFNEENRWALLNDVNDLVKSVNETVVVEEDRLSDHAYLYSTDTKLYTSV